MLKNQMLSKRGFTLLEILLVLVLISISAMAVISTFSGSSKDEAKQYINSMYYRMQLLNEEAILSGKNFGLEVDEEKGTLLFFELRGTNWKPLPATYNIEAKTILPEWLSVQFDLGSDIWKDNDRLFEPSSLFDEDMFADEEEEEKPNPQVFILSSGELTPFVLHFYLKEENISQGWQLEIKDNGQISMSSSEAGNES